MRQPLYHAIVTALIAGGLAASGNALAQDSQQPPQPQGLYSADELMDADVYLNDNRDEDIGDVEDILLGEDMSVQALIFEAGGVLDIGDNDYVVEKGQFTVETTENASLDNLGYRVYLDMSRDEIEQLPEYNNQWWTAAKNQSAQAWENTQEGASSAWQNTKEGAASAWESTKDVTSDILDNASEAIDNDRDN
ncbi:PRC-barrel domain containing protein [Halomonas sp. WWR20]